MLLPLLKICSRSNHPSAAITPNKGLVRYKTHYRNGAVLPMPKVKSFGLFAVIFSVVPGLFIGAAISKSVANFLEENDLFVPSDDDDDED